MNVTSSDRRSGRGGSAAMICWVALITLPLLSGCGFMRLKKELAEEQVSYGVSGRVEGLRTDHGDLIVLLYEKTADGLRLKHYTRPGRTNTYAFIATAGRYLIAAFEDLNHNGVLDPGEPCGAWGAPDEVTVFPGPKTDERRKALDHLNFRLTSGPFPVAGVAAAIGLPDQEVISLVHLGVVTDWGDSNFDPEAGVEGFWQPMSFLWRHGVGIYFLEPYDPDKIPVLFVHGAAGNPRAWKTLAEGLDRQRFQPWLFHYPSGLRLERIVISLDEMVQELHAHDGFSRMAVVAHSMGGLVSRGYILRSIYKDHSDSVKLFVSISTPWGGVDTAALGLEHAPVAIPSWHDVVPESDYIQGLYSKTLRPRVPFYLLFGYKGGTSLLMENNDGTVELASELDIRAQDDAVLVRGVNQNHREIFESKDVARYLNQALDEVFPKPE